MLEQVFIDFKIIEVPFYFQSLSRCIKSTSIYVDVLGNSLGGGGEQLVILGNATILKSFTTILLNNIIVY